MYRFSQGIKRGGQMLTRGYMCRYNTCRFPPTTIRLREQANPILELKPEQKWSDSSTLVPERRWLLFESVR